MFFLPSFRAFYKRKKRNLFFVSVIFNIFFWADARLISFFRWFFRDQIQISAIYQSSENKESDLSLIGDLSPNDWHNTFQRRRSNVG